MSFVGTHPEAVKYVEQYKNEYMAALFLPAGIMSETSIYYSDEDTLLSYAENADDVYVNDVLPGKMYYNLKSIENFSFWNDIKVMFMSFLLCWGKSMLENCL